MAEDPRLFITPYRENLLEKLGISEEDILTIFDEKSSNAGFFKRGTGKKLRKRCTPIDKFAYLIDQVVGVYDEQHPNEKLNKEPLAAVQGWFVVNGAGAYGVLLIYQDQAFILHTKFGANFGLVGLAATAKDLTRKMPVDLAKLVKANPLNKTSVFNYLHYGRFAFYVCSPLEVIHGLKIAKKLVDGDSPDITGSDIIETAKGMSL